MGRAKAMLFAGAATLLSLPAAQAADLPAMPPMRAPIIQDFSGWYLRGDIGMSNQRVGSLYNILYNDPGNTVQTVDKGFDSAPFFGIGVGYQYNSWLRFDVTGEYRGKANFHGLDILRNGGNVADDNYTASKSEWTGLANVYFDLGTWWCLTPFIGAGVGASYNTISSFRDLSLHTLSGTTSDAYANSASKWNLAWAVHAGVAYKVTPGFTVELAYRYLDLGSAQSGDIIAYDGTNTRYNPMEFKNITSHDVKLGVRWMLGEPEPMPAYAPPLMRKG